MNRDRIFFILIFLTGILFLITGSIFAKANFLYAVENRLDLNERLIREKINEVFFKNLSEEEFNSMSIEDMIKQISERKEFLEYRDELFNNIKSFNNEIKELNLIIDRFPNNIVCDIMNIKKRRQIEY
jgi:hypothetical protein